MLTRFTTNELIAHIENSIKFGELEVSKLTQDLINIPGLTSNKVKMFLNNLCNIDNSVYMELGVYKGATFCSSMFQNNIYGIGIDNWNEHELVPNTHLLTNQDFFNNSQEVFLSNVKKYCDTGKVEVYKNRFQDINYSNLQSPDIIFYDGDISVNETVDTLNKVLTSCLRTFILVVDDWNWSNKHVNKLLQYHKSTILYRKEIFTPIEDPDDFWNGLGVFLIENK